jgi:hypothetical protein
MAKLSRDAFPGLIPIGGGEQPLYMQVGKSAFSGVYTDATDVPVRTLLTNIDSIQLTIAETYSPTTDQAMTEYQIFSDGAVSSGTFSVFRSSQGAVSGLPFFYTVIGRVESTD